MSIHNRYSDIPLTEEDFTSFDAQLAIIEEIVSALQEPDSLVLRRVAKLGVKSDAFTRDALMLAAHHEELLPRGLDVQELKAQMRLRDELKRRTLAMKLMTRKMELIVQLLGSDVFSGALAAYKAMKTNHRGTLNEELRELGRLFRNRKKRAGEEEGPETKDEELRQHDSTPRQASESASKELTERESLSEANRRGTALMAEDPQDRAVHQIASASPCRTQPPIPEPLQLGEDTATQLATGSAKERERAVTNVSYCALPVVGRERSLT